MRSSSNIGEYNNNTLVYDHTVVVDINGRGVIDCGPGMHSTGNGRSTCSETAGTRKKDPNPPLGLSLTGEL